MSSSPELQALHDTERWFTRRGLPMFLEEYSSGTDVWTRALPALLVLFVFLLPSGGDRLLAITVDDDLETHVDADIPALAIALGVVLLLAAAYAALNLRRGRRPFARPERVGPALLAAFVLVPTLLTGVLADDWTEVPTVAVTALVLLGIVYVVTRYALLALTCWAVRWAFRQLGELFNLTIRVLPLLLLVVTFMFINAQTWQVAGTMSARVLWGSLAIFFLLAFAVLLSRAGDETARISTSADRGYVLAVLARTPLAQQADRLLDLDRPVPLARRQRWNVALVLVTAQSVQVVLIGVVVWAFFVGFGAIAVSFPVQELWLGTLSSVDPVIDFGNEHGVSRPLLRVATFLAMFAAFYATVVATGDRNYRDHFADRIGLHLRESFAVRRGYLAARRAAGLFAPAPYSPKDAPAAPSG